ncbi:MAG: class I SAM-dependent methyltransferase [Candidatus Delongbacteria bacterium]
MTQTVWDERFAGAEFVYGTAPNLWLQAQSGLLPSGGRALAVADGEGRNGVWLAEQGLEVTAVDASVVGLEKASRLARERGVAERYHPLLADLEDWTPPAGSFDLVALIYLHLGSALRPRLHARLAAGLAPGGLLVLECFTPRQLAHGTGGPSNPDQLYEPADLARDFAGLELLHLEERELELDEGLLHRGRSAVVRLLARG